MKKFLISAALSCVVPLAVNAQSTPYPTWVENYRSTPSIVSDFRSGYSSSFPSTISPYGNTCWWFTVGPATSTGQSISAQYFALDYNRYIAQYGAARALQEMEADESAVRGSYFSHRNIVVAGSTTITCGVALALGIEAVTP